MFGLSLVDTQGDGPSVPSRSPHWVRLPCPTSREPPGQADQRSILPQGRIGNGDFSRDARVIP
jgi:hypothetical protein